MEMIIGGLITLCGMLLYDKFRVKKTDKTEAVKQNTVEEEQQKRYMDHFDALFNYTPDKAYKKVGR